MKVRSLLFTPLLAILGISSCSHIKMGMFILKDNPGEGDTASIPRGKLAYEQNCARCHGASGDGTGEEGQYLEVKPTNFRSPVYTKSPARMGAHIAYGKGKFMPAFTDTLPEETIWDVSNFLWSLPKQ